MAPQLGVFPTGHDVWSKAGKPVDGAGALDATDEIDAALLDDCGIGATDEDDDATLDAILEEPGMEEISDDEMEMLEEDETIGRLEEIGSLEAVTELLLFVMTISMAGSLDVGAAGRRVMGAFDDTEDEEGSGARGIASRDSMLELDEVEFTLPSVTTLLRMSVV